MRRGSSMVRRRKDPEQVYQEVMAMFDTETRARVQGFIISYGLDTHDPMFLFGLANAHLMALVLQAPENWRALFDDFKLELDEWTTQNLRTLEAINQQNQTVERLTLGFHELAKLTTSSNKETLALSKSLSRLASSLKTHNDDLIALSGQTKTSNDRLDSRLKKTETAVDYATNQKTWIWISSFIALGAVFTGAGLGFRQIQQQNEQIEWLLEKAERQECVLNVVPRDTPRCQQYF